MGTRARLWIMGDFEPACLLRISSLVCLVGLVCLAVVTRVHAEGLAKAGEAPSTIALGEITAGFITLLTLLVRSWARRKGRGMTRQGSAVDEVARAGVAALAERMDRMNDAAADVRVEQAIAMSAMETRLGDRIRESSAQTKSLLEGHYDKLASEIKKSLARPVPVALTVTTPTLPEPEPATEERSKP
jgi:hypothetical protein